MIGQSRHFSLGDADRAVVRGNQGPQNEPETDWQTSGDRPHVLVPIPAFDAVMENIRAVAKNPPAARHRGNATSDGAATQRRAEADDVAADQVRRGFRCVQSQQSAETMADKVYFPVCNFFDSAQKALYAGLRATKHTRIVEQLDRISSCLDPAPQQGKRERSHPQAVDQDDVLRTARRQPRSAVA